MNNQSSNHNVNCDLVFERLTRSSFPALTSVENESAQDDAIVKHLQSCRSCREFAEAMQPAAELFHESMQCQEDLPACRIDFSKLEILPTNRATTAANSSVSPWNLTTESDSDQEQSPYIGDFLGDSSNTTQNRIPSQNKSTAPSKALAHPMSDLHVESSLQVARAMNHSDRIMIVAVLLIGVVFGCAINFGFQRQFAKQSARSYEAKIQAMVDAGRGTSSRTPAQVGAEAPKRDFPLVLAGNSKEVKNLIQNASCNSAHLVVTLAESSIGFSGMQTQNSAVLHDLCCSKCHQVRGMLEKGTNADAIKLCTACHVAHPQG